VRVLLVRDEADVSSSSSDDDADAKEGAKKDATKGNAASGAPGFFAKAAKAIGDAGGAPDDDPAADEPIPLFPPPPITREHLVATALLLPGLLAVWVANLLLAHVPLFRDLILERLRLFLQGKSPWGTVPGAADDGSAPAETAAARAARVAATPFQAGRVRVFLAFKLGAEWAVAAAVAYVVLRGARAVGKPFSASTRRLLHHALLVFLAAFCVLTYVFYSNLDPFERPESFPVGGDPLVFLLLATPTVLTVAIVSNAAFWAIVAEPYYATMVVVTRRRAAEAAARRRALRKKVMAAFAMAKQGVQMLKKGVEAAKAARATARELQDKQGKVEVSDDRADKTVAVAPGLDKLLPGTTATVPGEAGKAGAGAGAGGPLAGLLGAATGKAGAGAGAAAAAKAPGSMLSGILSRKR
jgi:hypothetical protein